LSNKSGQFLFDLNLPSSELAISDVQSDNIKNTTAVYVPPNLREHSPTPSITPARQRKAYPFDLNKLPLFEEDESASSQ